MTDTTTGDPGDAAADDDELRFDADLALLAPTRRWVSQRVRAAGAEPPVERVVALLTSELVGNAIKYGAVGGEVAVRVSLEDGAVRVDVSDGSSQPPVLRTPEPTAGSGRGLMFVDVLSTDWGVDTLDGGGKSVWFRVRL